MVEKRRVEVARSIRDQVTFTVSIDDLILVMWDNVSGGPHIRHDGYLLYWYIPYTLAGDQYCLKKRCNEDKLSMKVLIIPQEEDDPYYEAFQELVERAGKEPNA